jgi:hypothetical protein
MANRPIGELAGAIHEDLAGIVGDIGTLAKEEFRRDATKIAVSAAAFAAAAGGLVLAVVLGSIVIAEALIAAGLPAWAAFLIDVGIVLLAVGVFALVGVSMLRRLSGPKRTMAAVRGLWSAIAGRVPDGGPDAGEDGDAVASSEAG